MSLQPKITPLGSRSRSRYAYNYQDVDQFFARRATEHESRRNKAIQRVISKGAPYERCCAYRVDHAPYQPFTNLEAFEAHNLASGGPKPPQFERKSLCFINGCFARMGESPVSRKDYRLVQAQPKSVQ